MNREINWLELVTKDIKKSKYGYAVSWHMRLEHDIPTQKINYELGKLCKKGLLRKETSCYCTKYFLPNEPID